MTSNIVKEVLNMKASEARLLDFIKKSPQFVIPIYQRAYSWTTRECQRLWDDVLQSGEDDATMAHFLGSIVYVERGLYQVSNQDPLLVIDGQQRLTTVSILIEALARVLGDNEPVDGFSAVKLRNYYLLNPYESGERRFKLLLGETDRESLVALVEQQPFPRNYSKRIKECFDFFNQKLDRERDNLTTVCKGLAKLVIVDISLDRTQDKPQLIFESLNSTGKELTQADLIRNYVLMDLEPELQAVMYNNYWRRMELDFGQEAYAEHFDGFIRHYLTVRTGEIPKVRGVYDAFKRYAHSQVIQVGLEPLLKDIRTFAEYYCSIAFGKETDLELRQTFSHIRELKVDVAYPFLLELYDDYVGGKLTKEDFLTAVRLVESYVFRRAICAIPTNSMNKTFASFLRGIDKTRYLESVKAHFLMLPSYRRFPTDEEFRRDLKTRDLYNFRNRSYCLRRLENFQRKEAVAVDEYTIEHIMPQNENLSAAWRAMLGEDWKDVQEKWVHTLGNLTLTGYNSEYSDRPFIEKRDMVGGFGESPLRLNQMLRTLDTWNEETIVARAKELIDIAMEVWPAPQLSPGVLELYRPQPRPNEYSIRNHPSIDTGPMAEVFQALRKEIFALNPCVTEEYLKLYVAYKAETNFVDVIPQRKRPRLTLNMPYSEINDPKGICRNVTGLGRWGNGDVEVVLTSLEELPYIMGLIRQSLERQMGNEGY